MEVWLNTKKKYSDPNKILKIAKFLLMKKGEENKIIAMLAEISQVKTIEEFVSILNRYVPEIKLY